MMLECVICRRVQMPGHEVFLVLTPDERRDNHKHKRAVSHGYCDECFILFLQSEGVPEDEIMMELEGIKARKLISTLPKDKEVAVTTSYKQGKDGDS